MNDAITPMEHWAYQVDTPFRPLHEILELSEAVDEYVPTFEHEASWTGSADQIAFREKVLARHLAVAKAKRSPGRDLTGLERGKITGSSVEMRRDAAEAAGRLLAAANAALAQAKQSGHPDALRTVRVIPGSGYRSSAHQARTWRQNFKGYYNRTTKEREALPSGPHGDEAANYMITGFRIPRWVAAPGYSNHQAGIAIDLKQDRTGSPIPNSSKPVHLKAWRDSWLHREWLTRHAAEFGFQPYEREPWHWEYRQSSQPRFSPDTETVETEDEPEAAEWVEEVEPAEHEFDEPVFEGVLDEDWPEAEPENSAEPRFFVEEAEGFFDQARDAYRDAIDLAKTLYRIGQGIRDEKRLIELVLADRGGPPSPAMTEHVRDRIVRPALSTAPRSGYDRAGAVEYARRYWSRPCDDQFVALASGYRKVPAGTVFERDRAADGSELQSDHALLPDGSRIEWAELDDCTHFISCCIGERPGEPCGGLKISYRQFGSPPNAPYGIVRVSTMVEYLTGTGRWHDRPNSHAEIVAERTKDESAVGLLAQGDLIAYHSTGSRPGYRHLALLLPGGGITCHSYSRWDKDWRLALRDDRWTWTLIRMK